MIHAVHCEQLPALIAHEIPLRPSASCHLQAQSGVAEVGNSKGSSTAVNSASSSIGVWAYLAATRASFSPVPVTMQTIRLVEKFSLPAGSISPTEQPAEAGLPKASSLIAADIRTSVIASSVAESMMAPDSFRAATAFRHQHFFRVEGSPGCSVRLSTRLARISATPLRTAPRLSNPMPIFFFIEILPCPQNLLHSPRYLVCIQQIFDCATLFPFLKPVVQVPVYQLFPSFLLKLTFIPIYNLD